MFNPLAAPPPLTFVYVDIVLIVRLLNVGVDPSDLGGREGLHGTDKAGEENVKRSEDTLTLLT